MTEETKEIMDALIGSFTKAISELRAEVLNQGAEMKAEMKNFVTREEMVNLIKSISKKMDEQTNTLLNVLNRYEALTEKHEQTFQNFKKAIE